MARRTSREEKEALLRSVMKESATAAENLHAIYEKFCSIVGPPEKDEDGKLTCKNCQNTYKKSEIPRPRLRLIR